MQGQIERWRLVKTKSRSIGALPIRHDVRDAGSLADGFGGRRGWRARLRGSNPARAIRVCSGLAVSRWDSICSSFITLYYAVIDSALPVCVWVMSTYDQTKNAQTLSHQVISISACSAPWAAGR